MVLVQYPWNNVDPPESVKLSDPTGAFGARRVDTEEVLVVDGVDMTENTPGIWEYDIPVPLDEPDVEYWVEVVFDNETYHTQFFLGEGGGGVVSFKRLRFVAVQDGAVLTLATQPKLSNPSAAFGVLRLDTRAVVVSNDTSMAGTGDYYYNLSEPEANLQYRYYVESVVDDVTYFVARTTAYCDSAYLVIGRYCDSTLIESQFGADNVHKWLKIDDFEEPVDYALRLWQFMVDVDAEIDDLLRGGPYSVPFEDGVPETIASIAATLAGIRAYEARGILDQDGNGQVFHRYGAKKKQAYMRLTAIKSGDVRLSLDSAISYPQVLD